MITNSFDKFPNEPTGSMYEQFGKTSNSPSSDEVGETSGTSESKTLGVTGSRYRGGIKIATGSALIGQTLSPTKGIKFELKRTGLSGVHSLSRFEIWNDTTIISSATTTFQPDSKVGTSYAYVELFPASTVTLQANDRITIATDGGVTNYYTFRSNSSGTYDTTKTHWTESTYNAGSGGTWTDSDTSIDGNFKFTLVTQQPRVKQRFVEWFSGKSLPSYWNTDNITGTGTVSMADSVDGGLTITAGSGGADMTAIEFNNKTQFSPNASTCIVVGKTTASKQGGWGMLNDVSAGTHGIKTVINSTNTDPVRLYTADGSESAQTASSFICSSAQASFNLYKMWIESSNAYLSINGVLEATKSNNMPTSAMQPFAYVRLSSGITHIRYLEAYNT